MPTEVVLETGLLCIPRIVLFLACRKYLLRNLYSDLGSISSGENVGDSVFDSLPLPTARSPGAYQMEALPFPATGATSARHRRGVVRTSSLHVAISRDLFSSCFSESCMLFVLLMLQAVNVFTPRTRWMNWRISLWFLMSMILVIIPVCISSFIFAGPVSRGPSNLRRSFLGPRIVLSLVPVLLFLLALMRIPLPLSLQSSDAMTTTLSRLVVLGTIILGLLSGFGAVNNSWEFLPGLSQSRVEPTDHDITTAEYSLVSIREDLLRRQAELENRASIPASGTWFSRILPTLQGADNSQREVRGLEALEYQMSRNLEAMRERRRRLKFSGTLRGKMYNLFGRIFAFYCAARVLSSFINIIIPNHFRNQNTDHPRQSYPDIMTDFIAAVLTFLASHPALPAAPSHISTGHDAGGLGPSYALGSSAGLGLVAERELKEIVAVYVHQISLVLVGMIIVTSLRMVLRGVTRALRVTSKNLAISLMLLLLAQLMSTYLLSTIIQLRISFPPTSSSLTSLGIGLSSFSFLGSSSPSPTAPLGTLPDSTSLSNDTLSAPIPTNLFSTIPEYEVFGSLFDKSFLISSILFGTLRWVAEKINGVGQVD